LKKLKNLSLSAQYTFICAPVPIQYIEAVQSFAYYAKEFDSGQLVPIKIPSSLNADLKSLNGNEEEDAENSHQQHKAFMDILLKFEILHKILILYRWLSIRYPKIFVNGKEASEMCLKLENDIFKVLMDITAIKPHYISGGSKGPKKSPRTIVHSLK
jgi:hypothetical protein